tara:strand:+ start:251 stop:394 length:144 start_codon:yes stop_codon:yes gene_type:complete
VGIAKEHGHEFTAELVKRSVVELSEEELQSVTGGICAFNTKGCAYHP